MWRPSTGVIATRDPENILAMVADVVIHCSRLAPPYGSHDDDIIRLLASGKNVISINGYNNSRHWTGARREALEAACRAGCGLESGLCRRAYRRRRDRRPQSLDHIEVVKIADNRAIRSSAYAFNILGLSDAQHSP